MPVTVVAGVGDLAGGDLQRGEQRGRAVADVVVCAAGRQPRPHGQHRLGAVQRLDLAVLVDGQDDGLVGLSRPEARCRDRSRPVSPGRSPNPACDSHRTGLSAVPAVMAWLRSVQGLGMVFPL